MENIIKPQSLIDLINQTDQIDQTDEIDPYEFSMVYGILYSKRIFNLR